MSPPFVTARALSDRRVSLTWWTVGLVAYVAMILAVWPVIDDNEDFADLAESYPEALKSLFGGQDAFDALTSPTGFLGTYLFGWILPFALAALAISMGSGLVAGEDDRGLLDLLLSHPVRRARALQEKVVALVLAVAALGLVAGLLIAVVREPIDLDVSTTGLVAAMVGTVLFALLHGAVAIAIGCFGGRPGVATGASWGLVVGGYLCTVLADLVGSLAWLQQLSPLHHATADDPLVNSMPPNFLLLVALTVAVVMLAHRRFEHLDLR